MNSPDSPTSESATSHTSSDSHAWSERLVGRFRRTEDPRELSWVIVASAVIIAGVASAAGVSAGYAWVFGCLVMLVFVGAEYLFTRVR
ncbi:hypothetical protein G6M89_09515 [Natronolimnobius sp. AArcel1]|uniref:hypothetical protein n=1 Tax=Natronolimnobius sp. AArcel1 TaxID=1679093 RepID=UPI0013EA987F|nr:hypothetical protein [Natronolimnobius sp. AArcel1]NGM69241.1 hypothetical protein [Natronolimnobius sp. AArcel1]